MHHSAIEWVGIGLAVLAGIGQIAIIARLIGRKSYSKFPIFTTYAAFYVVTVVCGLSAYLFASCRQYSYVYWVLSFLFMALEFAVMYEVVANVLRPYSAIVDLGRLVFTWATVFLLAAGTLTALATSGPQADKLTAAFSVAERSMRLMECGLLLLFFFFEKRLSISWRNTNIAVALGLGTTGAVDLAISYLVTRFSSRAAELDLINLASYLGIVMFWFYCFSARQPEQKSVLDSPNRLIFQRWNEALSGYGYGNAPSTVESFLPGIEKTVDRVMARRVS